MSTIEYLQQLRKRIEDCCYIEGDFLLRSGKRTDFYFDKYQLESEPRLLHEIVANIHSENLLALGTVDYLAGLEMGGISIATVLSQETDIPMLQVRKERKEYGTQKIIEGPDFAGAQVAIVEDVITSGGAVLDAINSLVTEGASVTRVFCVILRDQLGRKKIEELGVPLYPLFDFTK